MATKKQPETTEAFVLVDCIFGKAGDVVVLATADAILGREVGMLDLAPSAIEAAKK